MAYLQARSGIARSGVTYCGWTPPSVTAYINGTDRTSSILREGWTLEARADGTPPIFRFRTKTITPTVGQDVKVCYATPNDYLFAGTLLQRVSAPVSPTSTQLQWDCVAVGYQWLMDRYDVVLREYDSVGVGTMVADILYRYTDGGFRVGYCPSSLGNLTMTFTFETVSQALQRIAKAKGAVLEITPEKIINIYVQGDFPETALSTITETAILGKTFRYFEDLTQVRTRSLFRGAGSTASAVTSPGSSTIAVDDTTNFSTAGGYVVTGRNLVFYVSRSVSSGPGYITGCSGILYDIQIGDPVNLLINLTDAGAVASLAAVLGGGLSGQATNYLEDGRISISEGTARATADIATFGGSLVDVDFTNKTPLRYVRAGRAVTLNVANPFSVTGTSTIQAITLTPYGKVGGTSFEVFQHMELGQFTRTVNDLLKQLRG